LSCAISVKLLRFGVEFERNPKICQMLLPRSYCEAIVYWFGSDLECTAIEWLFHQTGAYDGIDLWGHRTPPNGIYTSLVQNGCMSGFKG